MPSTARHPFAGHVFCNWCGRPTPMDYAHGHGQCLHCKTNIAPCCDGETACAARSVAPAPSPADTRPAR